MKKKSYVGLIVVGMLILGPSPSVGAWGGKSCSVYRNGKVVETVKHGKSHSFSDGLNKCDDGEWKVVGGSQSGGSSSSNKTVVSQFCNLSTTGMTSSWKGTMYSWVIYNKWSDGSKSVASSGSGYANTVPYGC